MISIILSLVALLISALIGLAGYMADAAGGEAWQRWGSIGCLVAWTWFVAAVTIRIMEALQ